MYGCAATFAGVWVIAWEPTSNETDAEGATGDADGEGHSLLAVDGTPTLGVGRRLGVSASRSRRSTVSLVGISPAQV